MSPWPRRLDGTRGRVNLLSFPRAREGGPSASGVEPAAPARSYRVGRGTPNRGLEATPMLRRPFGPLMRSPSSRSAAKSTST